MAYLGDPRENTYGPNGETWENDYRIEKRYYYMGAFTDLCDLDPKEYATTVFFVSGITSGSSPDPGPTPPTPVVPRGDVYVGFAEDENQITKEFIKQKLEDGNNTWAYKKVLTSDETINVSDMHNLVEGYAFFALLEKNGNFKPSKWKLNSTGMRMVVPGPDPQPIDPDDPSQGEEIFPGTPTITLDGVEYDVYRTIVVYRKYTGSEWDLEILL